MTDTPYAADLKQTVKPSNFRVPYTVIDAKQKVSICPAKRSLKASPLTRLSSNHHKQFTGGQNKWRAISAGQLRLSPAVFFSVDFFHFSHCIVLPFFFSFWRTIFALSPIFFNTAGLNFIF